jgi:hypothetical protein
MNWKQSVQFNGDVSTVKTLKFGVPQSPVLGPLLFLLYTADLGKLTDGCGLSSHFYADDSKLYTAGSPSASDEVHQRMILGIERIGSPDGWSQTACEWIHQRLIFFGVQRIGEVVSWVLRHWR